MANDDYLARLLKQADELTRQLADVQARIEAYASCPEGEFVTPSQAADEDGPESAGMRFIETGTLASC